ncbi:dihydropyrimidine dehydrogenase, partial [Candidatus Omnitrophota bacterium]
MSKPQRQEVKQQSAQERVKNFFEVSLGLTQEQALQEAKRCLECKNPLCVAGCPVEIDIPSFIKLIKENKIKESLAKIKEKN